MKVEVQSIRYQLTMTDRELGIMYNALGHAMEHSGWNDEGMGFLAELREQIQGLLHNTPRPTGES